MKIMPMKLAVKGLPRRFSSQHDGVIGLEPALLLKTTIKLKKYMKPLISLTIASAEL